MEGEISKGIAEMVAWEGEVYRIPRQIVTCAVCSGPINSDINVVRKP